MNDLQTAPEANGARRRLLFADDHRLLLDAYRLVAGKRFEVNTASSVEEFEAAMKERTPDLAVLDIHMPDGSGIEAAQRARSAKPELKVLFVSMHTERHHLQHALRAGASGFVPKTAPAEELLRAIETILDGGTYISGVEVPEQQDQDLTDRQKQVLKLIANGLSAKEIATDLNISVRTAEFHRASIMERLKVNSTAMMTRYAMEHGIC